MYAVVVVVVVVGVVYHFERQLISGIIRKTKPPDMHT